MTTMPQLLPNHAPTAAELATITTAITRAIPLKGLLLTNTAGAIGTTSAATELDLSKYQTSGLALVANRYYLLRANVTYTKTVAGDSFDFKLRANTALSGTVIGQSGFNPTLGNSGADITLEFVFKGDVTYATLFLSAVRSAGTGTLSYFGAQSGTPVLYRAWSALYDLGDSDNWTDVP